MRKHHPQNERIKRLYYSYLKEAKRYSEDTVDAVAKAIARFEADTGYRDFKAFHIEQAMAFKRRLAEQPGQRLGTKLSKSTLHATLAHLTRFIEWLAGQPGYKSKLRYSDAEYFNLSEKDVRVATAKRDQVGPTLEQVKHVISMMPADTAIERRDRGVVAFTLLTGARDRAISSMKLKHVNITDGYVEQDAREVATKFSKSFPTYFFPVGHEVTQVVIDWVTYLREVLLWGNDDPLFPATQVEVGEDHQFRATGLARTHWKNASRIRAIFKAASKAARLPYFNPHSLRNTLARLGLEVCRSPEDFKAWSQNLGHEKVLTTFTAYGQVSRTRQAEVIKGLQNPDAANGRTEITELAKHLARELIQAGLAIGQ